MKKSQITQLVFTFLLANALSVVGARAETDSDPCMANVNAASQAEELCGNFSLVRHRSVEQAKTKCVAFYSAAIDSLKAMCSYNRDINHFQLNSESLVTGMSSEQRQASETARRVDDGARRLSNTWNHDFVRKHRSLRSSYVEFQQANQEIARQGLELIQEEVNSCGRESSEVSLRFLGLAEVSTREGEDNYRRIEQELTRLVGQTLQNGAEAEAQALYNSERSQNLGNLMPQVQLGVQDPEHAPHVGHDPSYARAAAEAQTVAGGALQLERTLHHRIPASRVPNAAGGVAGTALLGVDALYRVYIKHEPLDRLYLSMLGARLVVIAVSAATAPMSAGASIAVGTVVEQGLTHLETYVRSRMEQALNNRMVEFVQFARNHRELTGSRQAAEAFHTQQNNSNCLSGEALARFNANRMRGNLERREAMQREQAAIRSAPRSEQDRLVREYQQRWQPAQQAVAATH